VAPVTDDSADDASLAYGFGAGHRDIVADGHDETAAARAPKSEFEKHADEEFDGASTTSDWRRSAMSFEVSEEDARRPAFSDEDLEPAPIEAAAEIVVEPIVESMPAIEPLPGAVIDLNLEAEPAPLTAADLKAPDSWQILPDDGAISAEGDQHSEWASDVPDVPSTPYPVATAEPQAELQGEIQVEAQAEVQAEAAVETSAAIAEPHPPEPVHEVVAESATPSPTQTISPEPSFAAKASHWMDAMGSPSGQSPSDWLTIIHSQQSHTADTAGEPVDHVDASSASVSASVNESATNPTETPSASHQVEEVSAVPVEFPESVQAVASAEPVAQHEDQSVSQEEEDWFFADDAPKDAVASPQDELEATVSQPVPVSSSHEETEFVEEEIAAPIASHDSELIEPPAVRVTPEPLLVDEHSPKATGTASGTPYGGHTDQEIAPAYTFLPPVEANADSALPASQPAREEESVPASSGDSQRATDVNASSPSATGENAVPAHVAPAPTREQLAHIPFLNPPPEFEKEAEKNTDYTVAQMTLDAVVQRILEKIEPQLQDLLSQNLKPLIENLVHTEIQKHDQSS
jgi:hypothetical protein